MCIDDTHGNIQQSSLIIRSPCNLLTHVCIYKCHILPLPLHGCITSEVLLLLQATMYSMHEVIYCLGTDACASYLHTHLGSAFNTLGSLTCKVHALQWHKWWASAAHCPMQAVKMRMLLLYSMPGSRGPAPCLHGGI